MPDFVAAAQVVRLRDETVIMYTTVSSNDCILAAMVILSKMNNVVTEFVFGNSKSYFHKSSICNTDKTVWIHVMNGTKCQIDNFSIVVYLLLITVFNEHVSASIEIPHAFCLLAFAVRPHNVWLDPSYDLSQTYIPGCKLIQSISTCMKLGRVYLTAACAQKYHYLCKNRPWHKTQI